MLQLLHNKNSPILTLAHKLKLSLGHPQDPARILGLYPQKGTLQVGSDADLVIFDPDKEFVIQNKKLHMNVDWSPYEGFQCRGFLNLVMRRGEILYREGEWIADKPRGKFISRRI